MIIKAKQPAPSSSKIIAKIDRTQSNAYQNKDKLRQTQDTHKQWEAHEKIEQQAKPI